MNASLQTAVAEGKTEEVQNNHNEGGEYFDINSLPPGYRFDPTDAETIFYLRKKIDHQPLPPNKILEVNLYAYDPDELAARYEPSGDDEWFYFTPRDRKFRNGQRPNRSVGDGWWKATGGDKEIKFEDRRVGYRKALAFYRGSFSHGVKTNWLMHEFRVAEPPEPSRRSGVNDMRLDDCVLCRVYRKGKRTSKRSRHDSGIEESGSSSSKIPRLELDPNPTEANNQLTVGGGIDSGEDGINYQYNYNSSQMPPQTQQPQPTTEIFQTSQQRDHFSPRNNPFQGVGNTRFPVLNPEVSMPVPTSRQSIQYIGNEYGGQDLDGFGILNGFFGNNSFDARDIDFGNNGSDGFTDFGNIPGLDGFTDFGNLPGLDGFTDFDNLPGLDSFDYGNPGIDYGNDDAQMQSSLLLGGKKHNGPL